MSEVNSHDIANILFVSVSILILVMGLIGAVLADQIADARNRILAEIGEQDKNPPSELGQAATPEAGSLPHEAIIADLRKQVKYWIHCTNMGGAPMMLDGVNPTMCAADPKDIHAIYGSATKFEDGRIFCELHAHRHQLAEVWSQLEQARELLQTVLIWRNSKDRPMMVLCVEIASFLASARP